MNESQNRHRRRRHVRLRKHDYSSPGLYFITCCVQDRICSLGFIENDQLVLSNIGVIVKAHWEAIPQHYAHVKLHEFVIMPNHIHGVIELHYGEDNLTTLKHRTLNQFAKPISGSISMIINQYKGGVRRWCKYHGYPEFRWQGRFYDHVIRNQQAYWAICRYIRNNPAKWILDYMNRP